MGWAIAVTFFPLVASSQSPVTQLRLSYNSGLDRMDGKTFFGLQHQTSLSLSDKMSAEFSGAWQKPTRPYENIKVPYLELGGYQAILNLNHLQGQIGLALSAYEVDRWSSDGRMIRNLLKFRLGTHLSQNFQTSLGLSGFFQWNQYLASASGVDHPQVGINEKIELAWSPLPFSLHLQLVFEQAYARRWINDFGWRERMGIFVYKNWLVGLAHTFLASVVDETTGSFRGFGFEEQKNHLIAFVLEGVI